MQQNVSFQTFSTLAIPVNGIELISRLSERKKEFKHAFTDNFIVKVKRCITSD